MPLRRRSLFPLLSSLFFFAACGYSAGGLYEHRAVRVRLFDNNDERRLHEFDLTRAVVRELQAGGVRVNTADAPVELVGSIVEITQPTAVEGKQDVVVVGSVVFRIQLVLRDLRTGRDLSTAERVESASFSTARAETLETARQEVFDRLARWVVTRLEKDW
jgi:hypothetical protein